MAVFSSRQSLALLVACCLVISNGAVRADVNLPSVFGNHMVLQQGQANPVWGSADPDETVTVRVGDQTRETKANG